MYKRTTTFFCANVVEHTNQKAIADLPAARKRQSLVAVHNAHHTSPWHDTTSLPRCFAMRMANAIVAPKAGKPHLTSLHHCQHAAQRADQTMRYTFPIPHAAPSRAQRRGTCQSDLARGCGRENVPEAADVHRRRGTYLVRVRLDRLGSSFRTRR
jgi:hypothetical protein